MKRLYVGCRVRIVRVRNFPEFLGRESVIVGWFRNAWCRQLGYYDGWELSVEVKGISYVALPSDLEPILPDGHKACDEDFKRDLDKLLERQGVVA